MGGNSSWELCQSGGASRGGEGQLKAGLWRVGRANRGVLDRREWEESAGMGGAMQRGRSLQGWGLAIEWENLVWMGPADAPPTTSVSTPRCAWI